ncbi:MAG: relaxase/mobilization nuclease domain-containing protein [Kocuria sp.]|nr:relaxase/mobilization nuclease domain-containing protein [Kocuria sp.]
MSTTYYAPSRSAAASEAYVRGLDDTRGVAIACDVPGPPGSWSAAAQALAEANGRPVQALHYRQSFSSTEFDPSDPEDVQRVNDLGYQLAKKMHPNSDALVVTHIDGKGGHPHNHILVINHNRETGRALENYRSFHDRPDQGGQRGVQSANDELMREHGLSIVQSPGHPPVDWEIRREDFAEDSLDRAMGDRMQAALMDPRSVDEGGLRTVLEEQNHGLDEYGDRVPRMRLVPSKNKKTGANVWTLKIQDLRDGARRTERRATCSRLSADFTPEGAAAFFDYHERMKEQDDERSTRAAEAAERAGRAAAAARQPGDDGGLDLDPCRRRSAELDDRATERAAEGTGRLREDHGRAADAPDGAAVESGVDLLDVRTRAAAERERRAQAQRDREDADRVRQRSRREAAARGGVDADHRGEQEPDGHGLGD